MPSLVGIAGKSHASEPDGEVTGGEDRIGEVMVKVGGGGVRVLGVTRAPVSHARVTKVNLNVEKTEVVDQREPWGQSQDESRT